MPTSPDQRAQMVPKMEEYEKALLKELAAEQVVKIDLAEYAVGSPHWLKLWDDIERVRQFQWPNRVMEGL